MFSLFSKFTAGAPEIRRFPPFGNNESDAYWIRIGNQGFRNRNPLWVRYEENPQVRDWLGSSEEVSRRIYRLRSDMKKKFRVFLRENLSKTIFTSIKSSG